MADTPYRSGAGLRALLGRMHYEHTDILESFGRDVFVMDGDSLLGYLLEAEDFPRPRVSGMPLDAARDDSALDMVSWLAKAAAPPAAAGVGRPRAAGGAHRARRGASLSAHACAPLPRPSTANRTRATSPAATPSSATSWARSSTCASAR